MNEKEICEKYLNGISNKELASIYKIHRTTIQRILKRNNIELRTKEETSRKHILVNFNQGIKNNKDAYILGLIFSDGNLSRNHIEITLHEKDKQILIDLSNYVYDYEKLSYRNEKTWQVGEKIYKSEGQWRFGITSKDVVKRLKPIGLKENKSLTLEYPKINCIFDKDFIRGYFDGDGAIIIPKKRDNVRIHIVGSHKFCEQLKEKLNKYLDINIILKKKTENVSSVNIYGKNQVEKFYKWLYKNSELKLNRKYEKFKEIYR
jgi:hypothetical protein